MSARRTIWLAFALASLMELVPQRAIAGNWPQWRGPKGTSATDERPLPVFWNEKSNVIWRVSLPEWGTSTPAVWGNAIFVTSHTLDNRLLLQAFEKRKGELVWEREVGGGEAERGKSRRSRQVFHDLHNLASPSPVTNGEVVVANFGNGLLAAYDFSGELLWSHHLQKEYGEYSVWYGHANSPVIHEDLVITVCMQDSLEGVEGETARESYLVAHELKSGKVRWKTPRVTKASAEECDSYTTPLLLTVGGAPQLVVMGGNQLDAYHPQTGKQIWYLDGLQGGRTVTSPTANENMIFATHGLKGPMIGMFLGRTGALKRKDVAWKNTQGSPDTCSLVVWNSLLFSITDDGLARCFDAESGNLKWKERLKGGYKASPIAGDGRVFFLNTEGLCTVVSASTRFDKLTESKLDDAGMASIAVSDRRFYIRGRETLYCIGTLDR